MTVFRPALLDAINYAYENPKSELYQKFTSRILPIDQPKLDLALETLLAIYGYQKMNVMAEKTIKIQRQFENWSSSKLMDTYRETGKFPYALILFLRGLGSMLGKEKNLELWQIILSTSQNYLDRNN